MKSVPPGGSLYTFEVAFTLHKASPERLRALQELLIEFATYAGESAELRFSGGNCAITLHVTEGDESSAKRIVSRKMDAYTAQMMIDVEDDEEWGFDFA